jgi:hypothetical protein
MPKVDDRFSAFITSASGPPATTRPARSIKAWVKPGGTSSTWCETSTIAGARESVASTLSVETRSSRPPRSKPAAGAFALTQSPEGAIDQLHCADLDQQVTGPVVIQIVVGLAPPADDPVGRRDHHVPDQLVTRDPFGDCSAGEPDPRPQFEDVDCPDTLAEDGRRARTRMHLGRADLDKGRFAGAVCAKHHPAVTFVDGPTDGIEQDRGATANGDVSQLQNGVHQSLSAGSRGPPSASNLQVTTLVA